MSETDIVKAYLNIPEEKRKQIQAQLKKEAEQEDQSRINLYLSAMAIILDGDIELKSRKRIHVDAKKVIAYFLHKKGFSEPQIGRVLKKDHSSIHLYIDEMRYALSRGMNYSLTNLYFDYLKVLEIYDIH